MADVKTKPSQASVKKFVDGVENERRREDCRTVVRMMEEVTGEKPVMWGGSIIGFGNYHYTYKSGREGDWMIVGVSPRKQNLTLYIMPGFDRYAKLMEQLGKHKTGTSCLYINKLDDVDLDVLETLVRESVDYMRTKHS